MPHPTSGEALEKVPLMESAVPLLSADLLRSTSRKFLNSVAVYIVSREWQDLLSVYIFNMHPMPHCSAATMQLMGWTFAPLVVTPECTRHAAARAQFLYALALLMVVSVALRPILDASWRLTGRVCAKFVGWGCADAIVQLMREQELDSPAPSVGAAVLVLVLAAMLLASMGATRTTELKASQGGVCASVRALLASVPVVDTVVVFPWMCVNDACVSVLLNLQKRGASAVATRPLLFAYACILTAGAAAVAVTIGACRRHLQPCAHSELGRRQARWQCWMRLIAEVCALAEAACGGIAGAAWTSAIFADDEELTPLSTLRAARSAVGLTVAAIVWLGLTASQVEAAATGRAETGSGGTALQWLRMCAAFLGGACSWFVGWSWVLLLRNIHALIARLFIRRGAAPVFGIFVRVDQANLLGFVGQAASVLTLGLIMTGAVLAASSGGVCAVQIIHRAGERSAHTLLRGTRLSRSASLLKGGSGGRESVSRTLSTSW